MSEHRTILWYGRQSCWIMDRIKLVLQFSIIVNRIMRISWRVHYIPRLPLLQGRNFVISGGCAIPN
jgi:hypothetical protein